MLTYNIAGLPENVKHITYKMTSIAYNISNIRYIIKNIASNIINLTCKYTFYKSCRIYKLYCTKIFSQLCFQEASSM